jgi:hypothetical protein
MAVPAASTTDLNCEDVAVPLDLSTMSVRELLGLWAGSLRAARTAYARDRANLQ